MAAILLAACSQDELAEQGTALPGGEYPLQIGSVSIIAESSEEPWTRVTEKPDGSGSVWQPYDAITVSLDGETATYTYDGSAWTSDAPLYWKNTQPAEVTAWYPATDGALDLSGQDKGLVYVLRATADNASHNTPVNLQFEHQLAKVRVIVKGTADVIDVEPMNVPIDCDVKEGEIVNTGTIIPRNHLMFKTNYEDIGPCWEINLPPSPDYQIKNFRVFTSDPIDIQCDITPSITLEAGKVHTITITAVIDGTQTIDLSTLTDTRVINDNGTYYVTGTGQYGIRVTNGNPNIYLEDAQISVSSGNAIDIQGGSPTIHVRGENTIGTGGSLYNYAAGIYVAQGSSVTIEGSGTSDVLRVTGGADGAAIGGYSPALNSHNPCGDITIHNVTLYAYASNACLNNLPIGIGSTGTASCGKIEITDAIVHARGYSSPNESTPAIGAYSGVPQIVISGSTIHAHRGSYGTTSFADYIGRGGNRIEYQGGQIQCGSGSITGSTVYKYSYNVQTGSSSDEGTVVYDASGNATEQPQ